MAKTPNLITGYHIPNTLVNGSGLEYPGSHKLHRSNIKFNNVHKLNGHTIDIEDINR